VTESGANGGDDAGKFELTEGEIAALRAAGGWARLFAVAGTIFLAVSALLIIAVVAKNPQGLRFLLYTQGTPTVAGIVLEAIGCVAAVVLVWGYGRGIAAFFVRGDIELSGAFRRLRQFFIILTCLLAVSAALSLLA
jgi:hypothetical protein